MKRAMKKAAGLLALGLFATAVIAGPDDKDQIDIKVRVLGTTKWLDVIDVKAGTNDTVEIEVGVFLNHRSGYAMGTCVCTVVTNNWGAGDVAVLVDRADSAKHPDGRQGLFNFGAQAQDAYTVGIDAGRLRIASVGNAADVSAGGISMHQLPPVLNDFSPYEDVFTYQFRVRLANPTPGSVSVRSLVSDAPLDRVNTYSVYESSTSTGSTSIRDSLVATDAAMIHVRWSKCPAACVVDFDCDGFATGDDFDAFVTAFEVGSAEADFDGNGFVTGDDFDAYVAEFVMGC